MNQQYSITITPNKDSSPIVGSKSIFSDLITKIADVMNKGIILSKIDITIDLIVPPGVEPLPMCRYHHDSSGVTVFAPDPMEYLRSTLIEVLPPIAKERTVCDIDDPDGWFQSLVRIFMSYYPDLKPEQITINAINSVFKKFGIYFYIYMIEEKCVLFQVDNNWRPIR